MLERPPNNRRLNQNTISRDLGEAERIGYLEAIFVLISIAFGVGYIDVFRADNVGFQTFPVVIQFINLVIGLVSVYMLSSAKQVHLNKLGSYQEIACYYFRSRSLIFIISFQYGVVLIFTAAYAL